MSSKPHYQAEFKYIESGLLDSTQSYCHYKAVKLTQPEAKRSKSNASSLNSESQIVQ